MRVINKRPLLYMYNFLLVRAYFAKTKQYKEEFYVRIF